MFFSQFKLINIGGYRCNVLRSYKIPLQSLNHNTIHLQGRTIMKIKTKMIGYSPDDHLINYIGDFNETTNIPDGNGPKDCGISIL